MYEPAAPSAAMARTASTAALSTPSGEVPKIAQRASAGDSGLPPSTLSTISLSGHGSQTPGGALDDHRDERERQQRRIRTHEPPAGRGDRGRITCA